MRNWLIGEVWKNRGTIKKQMLETNRTEKNKPHISKKQQTNTDLAHGEQHGQRTTNKQRVKAGTKIQADLNGIKRDRKNSKRIPWKHGRD